MSAHPALPSRCPLCSLNKMKDQLKDLELESRQPAHEDSPLTRKIRMLENRLDKVPSCVGNVWIANPTPRRKTPNHP